MSKWGKVQPLPAGSPRLDASQARHSCTLAIGVSDSDVLTALAPHSGDVIIVKSRHSGICNTNLNRILKELGITTLVFNRGTASIYVE